MREAFDQTFGAELGEVVSQRRQTIVIGGRVECHRRRYVQVTGGERIAGGDVGKAHDRVHQRVLPRVIEFQSWDALPVREACRFGELPQLPAIHEGLEDVLLDG